MKTAKEKDGEAMVISAGHLKKLIDTVNNSNYMLMSLDEISGSTENGYQVFQLPDTNRTPQQISRKISYFLQRIKRSLSCYSTP